MPRLYLAKINVNSSIFKVYSDRVSIKEILDKIMKNCSNDIEAVEYDKILIKDALGNNSHYDRITKYSFVEIDKDISKRVITGKIVRTYNKQNEKKNEITNKMESIDEVQNVSILFYFDVDKEMVTFCERQSFGYNQFMEGFALLLGRCCDNVTSFQLYLQKDNDILTEKLKRFKRVTNLKITIIPPNAEEDDLKELRSLMRTMGDPEEYNSTKTSIEHQSDNINIDSNSVRDTQKLVALGYGDMTALGVNSEGRKVVINSSKDAAFTIEIKDKISILEFIKESIGLMAKYISNRML